jgi:hypothetical protein
VAIKANLIIDQGTSFDTTINVSDDDNNPIDLTGYTAAAQMRKHYSSLTAYAFTATVDNNNGTVTLTMNAATTNSIPYGRYVYDCELTKASTSTVIRLVEGIVTISPQVTR